MAITPNDQTRQFDNPPGRGISVFSALAAPPATGVSAETKANNLVKNGSDGTGAGNNTVRPKSGSNWIAGGAVGGYGTVVAGTNPAPLQYAQRDAYKNQNDTASVSGPAIPVVTAGAPGGTSPTATVALSWPAVSTAASYRVEKSVKSGAVFGPWVPGVPATVTAPTVTITETGLASGQVRFRVFAVAAEESPPSNPVTVTIP